MKLPKYNFASFLLKTQNSILSATFVLAAAAGANALLGLVKNRVLANYFGTSTELALFFIADRIPGLIYSILVVGAISTIFIPIFSAQLKKDKAKAFETASYIINLTFVVFTAISSVILVLAEPTISLLTLNTMEPAEVTLGANIMRILLVGQMILVGGSLATSILQSYKYFLMPALAPLVFNIGMILGTVLLTPQFGIYAPAIGVVGGAILHLGIQLPLLRHTGFDYKFSFKFVKNGSGALLSLLPPRIAGVLLGNLVGVINNSLAILVSESSVVYLKFASQLQSFPVNLLGLSMAAACLPALSAESEDSGLVKFKKTFLTSFHQMMFLVLPMSMILFVLRVPAVRLVYGVANFPWEATLATAMALGIFSISIWSQSANYLLTRAFFALKDTVTPVAVSGVTVLAEIGLSLLFISVFKWGLWSLAFSFSIISILDFTALILLLNKKTGGFGFKNFASPFLKIGLATLLMGLTLYLPIKLLDKVIFDTTRTLNLLVLTGIAGTSGMATYLVFTWLFKVEEIKLFYALIRRLTFKKAAEAGSLVESTE